MIGWYIARESDGKITAVGACPRRKLEMQEVEDDHRIYIGNPNPIEKYVDTTDMDSDKPNLLDRIPFPNEFTPTPTDGVIFIDADGVDSATLSGLPDPCVLNINSEPFDIEGGTVTITSATPGQYLVSMDILEYQPKKWRIIADD